MNLPWETDQVLSAINDQKDKVLLTRNYNPQGITVRAFEITMSMKQYGRMAICFDVYSPN